VTPVADKITRGKLDALRRDGLEEIGGGLESRDAKPPRVYADGLIHPQTNVSRVKTSRTSADDVNYQNYPKRGAADAIEVRGLVRPLAADEVVVSFDYGQIQARNVGMESLDRALLAAFWNDYDIHHDFMEHLARIYPRWIKEGVRALASDKKLQKKYRNDVKHGFVFARFFGAGPKKTAGVLEVPVRATEKLDDIFSERFPGIPEWHESLQRDYYRLGYVAGHAGYRRRAPVSYNELINSPIQADEAKIMLDAMTRLSKIDHDLFQANMEIHDDLTFIWPKRKVDELAPTVIREMLEVPFEWAKVTPIVVEMSVGKDWATQKEVGVFASHRYDGIDMPRRCPI
ncbi:MAG: DNA polymerase, partial [Deltaproteobacteria bacterium]|nr:DNA polymerase [Deltaproteobacteria bacterium]